nr:uncharacterized protein LOC109156878 isoform X2 [Ipomoea batatas]
MSFAELSKWMSIERCLDKLIDVKPGDDRIGLLVVVGLLNTSEQSGYFKIPQTLNFHEYPPGLKLLPMGSRTAKPFLTTNLIVLVPERNHDVCSDDNLTAHGEALIVDPGCKSAFYEEKNIRPNQISSNSPSIRTDDMLGLRVMEEM